MTDEMPRCPRCHGPMEKGTTRFTYDGADPPLFIENVPAWICVDCGERTFAGSVADVLLRVTRVRGVPSRVLEVPVYDYAAAAREPTTTGVRG